MRKLLSGRGACPGVVKGCVKIVLSPAERSKVKKGDILVATHTTPLFTEALFNAAGIVTDKGGILSHAAIIARERGIPCVVGTQKATKVLKDGQTVTIDGGEGVVYG